MIGSELQERVRSAALVPILMAGHSDSAAAIAVADILVESGAELIEVLFRSPEAPATLAAIRNRHPKLLLAAGTILDAKGAKLAEDSGADLMISPGFSPALHAAAQASKLPLVPGVNTASEVQHARELGYLAQKFYPGWDLHQQRLPEFAMIYRDVTFLLTGGVEPATFADFAPHGNLAALGGSWMTKGPDAAKAFADDLRVWRGSRA